MSPTATRHLETASNPEALNRIVIEPLTRVEGHGKVTLLLDEDNRVQQARLHIVEFRGFEKFIQGRPYWEVPVLVQRLCGICPVSHHLAASKAVDMLVGARTLTPPPGGLSGIIEQKKEPEGPRVAREVATLVVHGRWVTLPGAIFKAFFKDYQTLSQPSFGAIYEWGDLDGSVWAVERHWTGPSTEAGNWPENATPPAGASHRTSPTTPTEGTKYCGPPCRPRGLAPPPPPAPVVGCFVVAP